MPTTSKSKRKRSLLEKFISGLASATSGEDTKDSRARVVPAGTYKTGRDAERELLGSGMARSAGAARAGRGAQIARQERGILGR